MKAHKVLRSQGIPSHASLGGRLRVLRTARRWSQTALARHLRISQPQLSEIERGNAALSAAALLEILRLFNVGIAYFDTPPPESDPLQSALVRHGASHLVEDGSLVPARYDEPLEVIYDVLARDASPRNLTALAPVLVKNIDRVALPALAARLAAVGRERRLGWLLESVRLALVSMGPPARLADRRAINRAKLVLELTATSNLVDPTRAGGQDLLDADIRSARTAAEIAAAASPEARRWGVVTTLTAADFIDALGAALGAAREAS